MKRLKYNDETVCNIGKINSLQLKRKRRNALPYMTSFGGTEKQ